MDHKQLVVELTTHLTDELFEGLKDVPSEYKYHVGVFILKQALNEFQHMPAIMSWIEESVDVAVDDSNSNMT